MKDGQNKKIGIGSVSLLLLMFGILFSFSWKNSEAFGDTILRFLGSLDTIPIVCVFSDL